MQEKRTQAQRVRGDSRDAWTGERAEVTVDKIFRAWVKMMKNKASAPGDYCVSLSVWPGLRGQFSECLLEETRCETGNRDEEVSACRVDFGAGEVVCSGGC